MILSDYEEPGWDDRHAVELSELQGEVIRRLAYTDGREVVVWVTDTGAGMSAADLSHVFDEFYQ